MTTICDVLLDYIADPKATQFHRWLDEQLHENYHGRTTLGQCADARRPQQRSSPIVAGRLFVHARPAVTDFSSPHAWVYTLIGIHWFLCRLNGDELTTDIREERAARLMMILNRVAGPDLICFKKRFLIAMQSWLTPWLLADVLPDHGTYSIAACRRCVGGECAGHTEWPEAAPYRQRLPQARRVCTSAGIADGPNG